MGSHFSKFDLIVSKSNIIDFFETADILMSRKFFILLSLLHFGEDLLVFSADQEQSDYVDDWKPRLVSTCSDFGNDGDTYW